MSVLWFGIGPLSRLWFRRSGHENYGCPPPAGDGPTDDDVDIVVTPFASDDQTAYRSTSLK